MEKANANESSGAPLDPNARYVTDDSHKAKARKWFARAAQLADSRNYDYAIKCFIDGLALWPDAVEEAHKPLRGTAMARLHGGGKKAGMMDSVKYSMTHKDPVKAMLNAEWLLCHDPQNAAFMEGMLKNANKARCDDTLIWIGPILKEAAEAEKKPNAKRFALLREVYEELGDRCQARGEPKIALDAYHFALEALNSQKRVSPKDTTLANEIRDLSTKLTILKGNYSSADSFQESLAAGDQQKSIHDRERMVTTDERFAELVKEAEEDWRNNPTVPTKLTSLVDVLCRPEKVEFELKAIRLLDEQYSRDGDYRFKHKADDIRMKQLQRAERVARDNGDPELIRKAKVKRLSFEIPVYAERVAKYPTDLRLKFEYGKRLFNAQKFDEAIPIFQAARADPKNKLQCALYIGRSFLSKKLHAQAATVLREGVDQCEIPDDETAKELTYWLARSLEAKGETSGAVKTFGKLLQMDYNYRDVRVRVESLQEGL